MTPTEAKENARGYMKGTTTSPLQKLLKNCEGAKSITLVSLEMKVQTNHKK